jgi:hypothetical protein
MGAVFDIQLLEALPRRALAAFHARRIPPRELVKEPTASICGATPAGSEHERLLARSMNGSRSQNDLEQNHAVDLATIGECQGCLDLEVRLRSVSFCVKDCKVIR